MKRDNKIKQFVFLLQINLKLFVLKLFVLITLPQIH